MLVGKVSKNITIRYITRFDSLIMDYKYFVHSVFNIFRIRSTHRNPYYCYE